MQKNSPLQTQIVIKFILLCISIRIKTEFVRKFNNKTKNKINSKVFKIRMFKLYIIFIVMKRDLKN